MESTISPGGERFTIVTDDDGLPVIRTTNGIITSALVKEIEALGDESGEA